MKVRKLLIYVSRFLVAVMLVSVFLCAPVPVVQAADGDIMAELAEQIAEAEAIKAGNAEFQLQISSTEDGSDVNQAFPWMYAEEYEELNAAIEAAKTASEAEAGDALARLNAAIGAVKSDGSDPYFRLDPGLGQVPIEITAPTNAWTLRARPLDNRIPSDYAGGTVEMIPYPFADSEGKADVLQINYVHNGTTTFGGISIESPLEPAVEVPEGATIEFDVYYPKSAQGKYMRWRISTTSTWETTDSYLREYEYNNLNPDWQGYWQDETWLKEHHSIVAPVGMSSTFILELHGENARPAETGVLLVSDIKITAPDPEGTPLPAVVNSQNQSEVAPLKSRYNEDNDLFMVGAIGTGAVNGTRARHYEIFVDGNNLKAEPTHPRGPAWLKDVEGNPLSGATTEPGLAEYNFPTSAYQAIRDSGEPGEYKMHGHVLAWYNQAPGWMRQIIPENLPSGYTGTEEFYGLGNGVTNTVRVDKESARRVQFNHIMYVMRHFLTTDEKYGSSEERGIIPFHSWDVLNEEVHESRHSELIPQDANNWRNSLKNTNWLVAMSDDAISGDLSEHYIYLLFKYAHIAAPNAQMAAAYKENYDSLPEYMKLDGHDNGGSIDAYVLDNPPLLTYNDYGTATRTKARTIYNMVRDLNTAWRSDPLYDGRPLIEVVGFQGHDSVSPTLASDNQYAMALYASLIDQGLLTSISFSEFDLKLLTDAPGGGATAPAVLNVKQSDALGYQYALMYKLFTRFAPYIDHIMSWGVQGSGWQGSYVLFDQQGNANAGYYGAMNPDRYILGHSYLDDYFAGEYAKLQSDYAIDLGDLGTYLPKGSSYTVTVTGGSGSGKYTEGVPVTIAADPAEEGKVFAGWAGAEGLTFTSGSAATQEAVFTMPAADVALTATYADVTLTSIAVTTPPDKTVYTEGEFFDPAGMTVTATYSDQSTKEVTEFETIPEGALKVSDTAVTIRYTEGDITVTATQAITVNPSAERAQAVEEQIDALPSPEEVEIDNEEHIRAIEAAKEAYDALTTYERGLIRDEAKEKLAALVEALTDYRILEGDGAEWTKGAKDGLTFIANGWIEKFDSVRIDGDVLEEEAYTAEAGSTVITLKAEYLERLAEGKHEIVIVYTDGAATGSFAVLAKGTGGTPGTGDGGGLLFWAALVLIGGGLSGTLAVYAGRKRKHS